MRTSTTLRRESTSEQVHNRILREARERLRKHHQFRGREDLIRLDETAGTLVLKGRVPSFYVKQLLQTVLQGIDGVTELNNQVRVLYPK